MIRKITILFILLYSLLTGFRQDASGAATYVEHGLQYRQFGKVQIYMPTGKPSHVVLFVSGDGGWRLGVVSMARSLTTLNTMVVGIDIRHFLQQLNLASQKCSYPAADFEDLSKFVQQSFHFPKYISPYLLGYSSGATLVYAALVEAPPTTFAGGVGLGFCPDLLLHKPLCKGRGLEWTLGPKPDTYNFLAAKTLEEPWIALQGTVDSICNPSEMQKFSKEVTNGEIVMLPSVGHGYSAPKNWMPQFHNVFEKLFSEQRTQLHPTETLPVAAEIKDLPIIELPGQPSKGDSLAVIVSGDGGWANIDREMGDYLSKQGIPVVGWNSLQYFWKKRTPEETGKDLKRILEHYFSAWNKQNALLIGYSFGADVLPFMANRLPPELLKRVKVISLLGPSQTADFEFHLTDWLNNSDDTSPRTKPELERLKGPHVLCFYGENEEDSLCNEVDPKVVTRVPISGGHHFGGDYQGIVHRILAELSS